MYIISDLAYTKHDTGFGHPERPERINAILNALKTTHLLTHILKPRMAEKEEILLCHTSEYYELAKKEIQNLKEPVFLSTGDVVVSSQSFEIAHLSNKQARLR